VQSQPQEKSVSHELFELFASLEQRLNNFQEWCEQQLSTEGFAAREVASSKSEMSILNARLSALENLRLPDLEHEQVERLGKLEVELQLLRTRLQDGPRDLSNPMDVASCTPEQEEEDLESKVLTPPDHGEGADACLTEGAYERLCKLEEQIGGITILDDRVVELQLILQQLMGPDQLQVIAEETHGSVVDGEFAHGDSENGERIVDGIPHDIVVGDPIAHLEESEQVNGGDQATHMRARHLQQVMSGDHVDEFELMANGQGQFSDGAASIEERVFKVEQFFEQTDLPELAGSVSNIEERVFRLEHGFEQLAVATQAQAAAAKQEMETVRGSMSVVSSRLEEALMTLDVEPNTEEGDSWDRQLSSTTLPPA